jgi:hypothetical protein
VGQAEVRAAGIRHGRLGEHGRERYRVATFHSAAFSVTNAFSVHEHLGFIAAAETSAVPVVKWCQGVVMGGRRSCWLLARAR